MIRAVSKASLDTPEALRRFSSNALFPFIAQLFHVLVSVDALPDLSAQAIKFQNAMPLSNVVAALQSFATLSDSSTYSTP